MRPTDLYPQILIDELLRLYKRDPGWVQYIECDNLAYQAHCPYDTWLRKLWTTGADTFGTWAASTWLGTGPKVFIPTAEQCTALENVSVGIPFEDYSQPYPALLVVLPKGKYAPFTSVLCHKSEKILVCSLQSGVTHENDICTTITAKCGLVEESLLKFDKDCIALGPVAALALRVACNSCLVLSHYGNHLDYLFPEEVKRDQRLGREQSERGERARGRIPLAVMVASLDQQVKLHRTESRPRGETEPSGKEMPFHWRKGHWAMQPHGPNNSLRKRILRRPVMVRADLLLCGPENTSTTYKG